MEISSNDSVTMETSSKDSVNMETSSKDSVTMETSSKDSITMETSSKDSVTMETSSKYSITMETSSCLVFYVNGVKVEEQAADPETTLLTFLRNKLGLTGSKLGCGEGGCGACTVMVSRMDRHLNTILHYAVNACLAPLVSMHGLAVTTVEGIGSSRTKLHPIQERLAAAHGSQCGFCTPGFVMSMYALLRTQPLPSRHQLDQAFQGNLCRCTGYRPIIEGLKSFTREAVCGLGENCCQRMVNGPTLTNGQTQQQTEKSTACQVNATASLTNGLDPLSCNGNAHTNGLEHGISQGRPVKAARPPIYDPSQEPIFPSQLQLSAVYDQEALMFTGPSVTWYRPVTLHHVLHLVEEWPTAKLINGNTEIGIEMKLKLAHYPVLISLCNVDALCDVTDSPGGVYVGAACTLTRLEVALQAAIEELPEHQTRIFAAVVEMLTWFAGPQIRNVASIGGNIMTASPISDLNPLLMAAEAELHIAAKGRPVRTVTMDGNFFTGYRKTCLAPGEILQGLVIPYSNQDVYFHGYKQARRREDDIAIVNAGMKVTMVTGSDVIDDVVLSYGGMAATTVLAERTMNALRGRRWDAAMLEDACRLLQADLPLVPGSPGGMELYRKTLTTSFFYKFYLTVQRQLHEHQVCGEDIADCEVSATTRPPLTPSSGTQAYETRGGVGLTTDVETRNGEMRDEKTREGETRDRETRNGETRNGETRNGETRNGETRNGEMKEGETRDSIPYTAVGQTLPHQSGIKHTTGEAVYVDDMPHYTDELYMCLVTSTRAHALILHVDTSDALLMPGVTSYVDHRDVPGLNETGAVDKDEEIFATKKVTCQGQTIGAIIAETALQARQAANKVKVEYQDLDPVISIQSAIERDSYYDDYHKGITCGDVSARLATSHDVISGEVRMGGQEHFYLETQASLVVPRGEDRDVEVYSSCQSPSEAQVLVARALGVGAHRVTMRVKRIGGGFGGKQTRYSLVLLPAAVAAIKLGRPIRCMLERDQDMMMTGTRHPYYSKYTVGFSKEGQIEALDLHLYSNAGNSLDLSWPVLEKALLQADNCYSLPVASVQGHLCKTNIPSCTAYRGFGGPQGMFMIEAIIQEISEHLDLPAHIVRERNLYDDGDVTYYRMQVNNSNIRRCWSDVINQSDYVTRRQEAAQFNSKNKWRKRGIAVVPTKFGVGFTEIFFNQAGALVNIYNDGTVLVAHSGTEMGQGLHTKMIQVACQVLDVPVSKVFVNETSTAVTPNVSPSAASVGSDLNGMAVMRACEKLVDRLAPYRKKAPDASWEDWVMSAYLDRVNLSASGFYKTPDVAGYDWTSTSGRTRPYSYFTSGAAVTEVEVDSLTGDHQVLRTDIVMDIGQSINPAIDVSQIEGGFVQGYGLFTLEEQLYSPDGCLYSRGPGTYKIPALGDIPQQFNVTLLKGSHNPRAVYSSRAVGEPPLFLGASVFFAIKDAVFAARKSSGVTGRFRLDSPATAERIRLGCTDRFTEQHTSPEPGTYRPWTVPL